LLLPQRRLEITLLFGEQPEARHAALDAAQGWLRRLTGIIPYA
jgi:hypothetical protein